MNNIVVSLPFIQIRKLEFLLADAIEQGCDSVITFGGFSSNHSRATVMAARELGLQTHVLVLSPTPEVNIIIAIAMGSLVSYILAIPSLKSHLEISAKVFYFHCTIHKKEMLEILESL